MRHDAKVRPDHMDLDGKVCFWDSPPLVDRARELAPAIESFLQQPLGESTPPAESWDWLQRIARSA